MELIAVVMGCETSKERNAACKQLLDYGFANFAYIAPALPEGATVPVTLGRADSVSAIVSGDTGLLIDKAQKSSVTTEMDLLPSVAAPVSRGQKLGTMTIRSGEQILAQVPLVAANGVERLNWGDLFLRTLRRVAMAGE
jgi:D-alanyl-D-alanine carboxypeptidase (penicillin-binding protein 5/6)